jgi:RNA polymerase sigma factor (sigma-70 family)
MGWNPAGPSGLLADEVPALRPTAAEPTDGEAIARSLSDPQAFCLLFERHFDVLYGYLARRLGASLGEELAAETFATAFEKRARYSPAYPDARPWLFGIALNLARTHARKERRELRALARTGVDPLLSGSALPEGDPTARELAAALAKLDRRDREVLLLFFWADLSYEAIATALSVPVGTVRSRLSRARRRLRELLERSGQSGARPIPTVATDEGGK